MAVASRDLRPICQTADLNRRAFANDGAIAKATRGAVSPGPKRTIRFNGYRVVSPDPADGAFQKPKGVIPKTFQGKIWATANVNNLVMFVKNRRRGKFVFVCLFMS